MKAITKVFVGAQLGDIVTTLGSNSLLGTWEVGPASALVDGGVGWYGIILLKLASIGVVALALEKIPFKSKLVWIIPGLTVAIVTWNLVVILAELYARFAH